ncbi:MAG: glycine cleavage system H protein [Candidatus Omnitrophota bacterium]|jgi:glycine cleavage system H protein
MDVEVIDHFLYTKEHEWVSVEDGIATIGITEHAQSSLGDITFIELPAIDDEADQFEEVASVESVKAASDIFAAVSGKIVAVNTDLEEEPGFINKSCYDKGWIAKIELADEDDKNNLMTAGEYRKFLISSG